jgi:hypothetical protein
LRAQVVHWTGESADGVDEEDSGDTEGWERGGQGAEPASHLDVLRILQQLMDAGLLITRPCLLGSRVLAICSAQVRHSVGVFVFVVVCVHARFA